MTNDLTNEEDNKQKNGKIKKHIKLMKIPDGYLLVKLRIYWPLYSTEGCALGRRLHQDSSHKHTPSWHALSPGKEW